MRHAIGWLVSVWILIAPLPADAQSLDPEAIKLISETAAAICGDFAREGEWSESQIEGAAEARLKGLAGKLVDLGIEGGGSLDAGNYAGVLREELGGELKDVRACRLQIWKDMQAQVLKAAPEPQSLAPAPPEMPAAGSDLAALLREITELAGSNPSEADAAWLREMEALAASDPDAFSDFFQAPDPGGVGDVIAGSVFFGQALACVVYNYDFAPVTVATINYDINGAFGYQPVSIPCTFNCVLPGNGGGNTFSGPPNSADIYTAGCSVSVYR